MSAYPRQFGVADAVLETSAREGLEPGLVCERCGACWQPLKLRRLADVTCPSCGALYADVAWNREP